MNESADRQGFNPPDPLAPERDRLAVWMDRVAVEMARTRQGFSAEVVHDLRVALRRCLSIVEVHEAMDALGQWREIRKSAQVLFRRLSDLRDTQVMTEWCGRLAGEKDPARIHMENYLASREKELRDAAVHALDGFPQKKWQKWQRKIADDSPDWLLDGRSRYELALRRLQKAYGRHREALRNRSHAAYHRLRISVKRFRYFVENYLPRCHEHWGKDLRFIQDQLGEYHDLFVLWETANKIGAFRDAGIRSSWRSRILEESAARRRAYRDKASGKDSVWEIWRRELSPESPCGQGADSPVPPADAADSRQFRISTLGRLAMSMNRKLMVQPGRKPRIDRRDPAATPGVKDKDDAAELIEKNIRRLADLQYLLYAESRRAVLVVIQAMDAGGKDGIIRHVMTGLNPQGCRVTAFKVPTPEELHHDFLWRVHKAVPAAGEVGIFNRSHYEDVLVARVHKLVPRAVWAERYRQINAFEEMLALNNVIILKFFLHISREEQKKRFEERLSDPTKQWKISEADFSERRYWDDYMAAYEEALSHCSTTWAPWYVVPADHKWFRNLAVSQILVERMEELGMKFPKPVVKLRKVPR